MVNQPGVNLNFCDQYALMFIIECPVCKCEFFCETEHTAEVLALVNRIADLESQLSAARDPLYHESNRN
jgi:hypothetical protein